MRYIQFSAVLLILLLSAWHHPVLAAESVNEQQGKVINFGVEAQGVDLQKLYGSILEYLQEQTGYQFVINEFKDDTEMLTHLLNGNVQVAHFSTSLYAKTLREKIPLQYIVTVSESGIANPDFYRGYIFTKKTTGITSFAGLKGKSFMFTEMDSTSGYKYPLFLLLKNSINPKQDFSSIFFGGGHEAVTQAVAGGQVDAGATWDGNYEKAVKQYGDIFTIIGQTPPIPNEPFVAGPGVSKEIVDMLQKVMLGISSETRTQNGQLVINKLFFSEMEINSFSRRGPEFYQVTMDMEESIQSYH